MKLQGGDGEQRGDGENSTAHGRSRGSRVVEVLDAQGGCLDTAVYRNGNNKRELDLPVLTTVPSICSPDLRPFSVIGTLLFSPARHVSTVALIIACQRLTSMSEEHPGPQEVRSSGSFEKRNFSTRYQSFLRVLVPIIKLTSVRRAGYRYTV